MKADDFEIIEINGMPALKNTLDCVDIGPSVEIYTLKENKLYSMGITAAREDIERCKQEFSQFLETVLIN